MSWADDMLLMLVLDKHAKDEIRRLDEKAAMMRAGTFDDRARVSDAAWKSRNAAILDTVLVRLDPPHAS